MNQQMCKHNLKCEKVVDLPDPIRDTLMHKFKNDRNNNLVNALVKCGKSRDVALYYIVFIDETPLFFFSLRTSMLYSDRIELSVQNKHFATTLSHLISTNGCTTLDSIRKVLIEYGVIPVEAQLSEVKNLLHKAHCIHAYKEELRNDTNLAVFQKVIPCIELVEFCRCTSEDAKEYQKLLGFDKQFGAYVMYVYIADIIQKIYDLVGCNHLILYAADSSKDKSLLGYYKREYGFYQSKEFITVKPLYDASCPLLVLDIQQLFDDAEYYKKSSSYNSVVDAVRDSEHHEIADTSS